MWFNPYDLLNIEAKSPADSSNSEIKISKLAELATYPVKQKPVSCRQCLHFRCNNAHGGGAGRCLSGGAYGAWSETKHHCTFFDAAVEWRQISGPKPNALIATVYTPAGNALKVEASSPEHATFLKRMNPKPGEAIYVQDS